MELQKLRKALDTIFKEVYTTEGTCTIEGQENMSESILTFRSIKPINKNGPENLVGQIAEFWLEQKSEGQVTIEFLNGKQSEVLEDENHFINHLADFQNNALD